MTTKHTDRNTDDNKPKRLNVNLEKPHHSINAEQLSLMLRMILSYGNAVIRNLTLANFLGNPRARTIFTLQWRVWPT